MQAYLVLGATFVKLSWKESACHVGDLGSIPGLGRSPGEGIGYPLQYSGLESSMDCIVLTYTSWCALLGTPSKPVGGGGGGKLLQRQQWTGPQWRGAGCVQEVTSSVGDGVTPKYRLRLKTKLFLSCPQSG